MTPKETRLLAAMLNEYSDRLSNDGCNDWDWPDDWTHDERVAFVKDFHDYNGDPEEFDSTELNLPNYCVIGLLRAKLLKLPLSPTPQRSER